MFRSFKSYSNLCIRKHYNTIKHTTMKNYTITYSLASDNSVHTESVNAPNKRDALKQFARLGKACTILSTKPATSKGNAPLIGMALILFALFVTFRASSATPHRANLFAFVAANDSITSLTIYPEKRGDTVLYSLDFNKLVGYDYLTESEAIRAIQVYPKSIYHN